MSKINEYPQAVTINNNDLFVIDQQSGGDHATKSASVSQIADKVTDGLTANDIPLTSSDPTPTATAIGDLSTLETVTISTSGAITSLYQSNASKQNKLVVVNLNLALTSATSLYALLCTLSKKPISEIQIFLHSSSDNGFHECHLGADGTITWWNSTVIPSNTSLIGQFVYFTND